MATGKHVKAEEYDTLKTLTNVGLSFGQFKKVTGRHGVVYELVKASKDFADYKRLGYERNLKYKKPSAAKPVQPSLAVDDLAVEELTAPQGAYSQDELQRLLAEATTALVNTAEWMVNVDAKLEQIHSDIQFIVEHMLIDPDAPNHIALKEHQADQARIGKEQATGGKKRFWQ